MTKEEFLTIKKDEVTIKDCISVIHEYIHEVIPLKELKNGKDKLYKTNCLFDINHSMYYQPMEKEFTCPVCGFSNDIITLFSNLQNKSKWDIILSIFKEKLKMDTSLVLTAKRKEDFKKELLYQINYDAMLYFEEQLYQNKEAMDYLLSRGLKEETIKKFHIGYAPKYNKFYNNLKTTFKNEDLEEVGLIGMDKKTNKPYDVFKDRIMFPIMEKSKEGLEIDQIIGFGGRTLGSSPKKYINTKTTSIFQKSNCLYGFNMIQEKENVKEILVCEGYLDVIALFEEGIDFSVATLGTALTKTHYEMLIKKAEKVTVVFDGDDAGMNAASRTLQKVGKLNALTLPEQKDPDEYIKEKGKQAFLSLMKKETKTWEEYWLLQYEKEKKKVNIFDYYLSQLSQL